MFGEQVVQECSPVYISILWRNAKEIHSIHLVCNCETLTKVYKQIHTRSKHYTPGRGKIVPRNLI